MEPTGPATDDPRFPSIEALRERRQYWRRKLKRLRLDAEPVEEQVARYRRVTWALTAVPLGIALMFVGLFTAFGRPDLGLIFSGAVLLPIVVLAWIDHAILSLRARRYLREFPSKKKSDPGAGWTTASDDRWPSLDG